MTEYIPVLAVDELAVNTNRAVDVQGRSILICHAVDGFHALINRCSHQAKPLEGGRIRGNSLFCPVHGACFDLRTGKPRGELTRVAIEVFPVRVVDGTVEVALPEG